MLARSGPVVPHDRGHIYGDSDDPEILNQHQMLARDPGLLGSAKHVLCSRPGDDHDYGVNDGGEEVLWAREDSQRIFNDFFQVRHFDSPRRFCLAFMTLATPGPAATRVAARHPLFSFTSCRDSA
ncbi:MAG: hypothetical protein R3B96_03775 [Pirellulaceae bacterium]